MSRFSETIKIINGNPFVRPPDEILQKIFKQAGNDRGHITVRGKLNSASFQQGLVKYEGDWRLYINGIMAKAAGLKFGKSISEIVGEKVKIEIEFDESPPKYEMVDFLQVALDANPVAKSNWEKLTPGGQKEVLRYFSWLKSDEAKKRNLEKLFQALSGKEARFMARDWKNGK